jgi:hypothetical protein
LANSQIEKVYNARIAEIDAETPWLCDTRGSEKAIAEKNAVERKAEVKRTFLAADTKNLENAKALLASMGQTVEVGGTYQELMGSVNQQINIAMTNIDKLARQTLSTADDAQYLEANFGMAKALKAGIVNAFGLRRVAILIKQAVNDIRGLVHQEMTGIGGRKSNLDAAARMNEADLKQASVYFNEIWAEIRTVISEHNQIRWYEIQAEKLKRQILMMQIAEFIGAVGKIFSYEATLEDVVGLILSAVGGIAGVVGAALQIMGMLTSYIAGMVSAAGQDFQAHQLYEIELEYGYQVIKPTDVAAEAGGRTLELPAGANAQVLANGNYQLTVGGNIQLSADGKTVIITTGAGTVRLAVNGTSVSVANGQVTIASTAAIVTGGNVTVAANGNIQFTANGTNVQVAAAGENNWLTTTRNAEQTVFEIQNNMTAANYLVTMNDAHATNYAGSSAFDTVKFGRAMELISVADLMILIANTVRTTMAEMRNLVHMEMTGVGGRESSSMVTYALEAARMQQAFVTNGIFTHIFDMNVANNLRFQRDQRLRLLENAKNNADEGMGWSYVPIIGGLVGGADTALTDLYDQKEMYEETARAVLETESEFTNPELNGLIENGLIDTGNSNVGVDYQKISDARAKAIGEFIAADVRANIHKVLRQMRSFAHQEMTNIQSSVGGDLSDQANVILAQTAMDSISMLTQYLAQKAQIENRVTEANKKIDKLNTQIDAEWTGVAVSAVITIGGSMFGSEYGELGLQISNIIMGAVNTFNSWIEYAFELGQAKDDLGEIQNYLTIKQTMETNPNSTTSRLENLEQQCLEEINANLLQDLGAGFIGVNRGMAAKYKDFMEQIYRAENKKAELREMVQELRNVVHEAMTGISGVTANAASEILQLKESEIKAQIDDMFGKLEVLSQRWNQITQAEMAAEVALINAIMSSISLAIEIAEFAAEQAMSSAQSKEKSAQKGVNEAKGKLDDAKQKLADAKKSNAPAETIATLQHNVDMAEAGLNAAEGKLEAGISDKNALSAVRGLALPALDVLAKLIVAFLGRKLMTTVKESREGKVAGAGITKGAKGSNVMAENMSPGSIDDYGALVEAASGQTMLDNEAAIDRSQVKSQIDGTFANNMIDVREKAINLALSPALLPKAVEHLNSLSVTKRFGNMLDKIEGLSPAQNKELQKTFKSELALDKKASVALLDERMDTMTPRLTKTDRLTDPQKEAVHAAAVAAIDPSKANVLAAAVAAKAAELNASPVKTPTTEIGKTTVKTPATQAVPQVETPAAPGPIQVNQKIDKAVKQTQDGRAAAKAQSKAASVSAPATTRSQTEIAANVGAFANALGKLMLRLLKMDPRLAKIMDAGERMKEMEAASQGIQAAQQFANTQTVSASDQQQTHNTSNIAAWIDQLSADIDKWANVGTELTTEINKTQAQQVQAGQQPQSVEDLKNYLETLKKQLEVARKELSAAKTQLTAMKKDVPEAQRTVAVLAETLKLEREKRLKDMKDVEDKMKELDKLGSNNPSAKKIVEQQAVALNKMFIDLQKSFKVIQEKYDIAGYAVNNLNNDIKGQEGKVNELKGKIGGYQSEIKQIQVALVKMNKNDKGATGNGNNVDHQTDDLLAQFREKSPMFHGVR